MGLTNDKLLILAERAPAALDFAVRSKITDTLQNADNIFDLGSHRGRTLSVRYNLKGKTAGMALLSEDCIRLNLELLLNPATRDDMLAQTIPHEVVHFIHYWLFPLDKEWHGARWQWLMVKLGLKPDRCHSYEVKPARKTRKFEYDCACGITHKIGLNRHKRIQLERAGIYCQRCMTYLRDMSWEEITPNADTR